MFSGNVSTGTKPEVARVLPRPGPRPRHGNDSPTPLLERRLLGALVLLDMRQEACPAIHELGDAHSTPKAVAWPLQSVAA